MYNTKVVDTSTQYEEAKSIFTLLEVIQKIGMLKGSYYEEICNSAILALTTAQRIQLETHKTTTHPLEALNIYLSATIHNIEMEPFNNNVGISDKDSFEKMLEKSGSILKGCKYLKETDNMLHKKIISYSYSYRLIRSRFDEKQDVFSLMQSLGLEKKMIDEIHTTTADPLYTLAEKTSAVEQVQTLIRAIRENNINDLEQIRVNDEDIIGVIKYINKYSDIYDLQDYYEKIAMAFALYYDPASHADIYVDVEYACRIIGSGKLFLRKGETIDSYDREAFVNNVYTTIKNIKKLEGVANIIAYMYDCFDPEKKAYDNNQSSQIKIEGFNKDDAIPITSKIFSMVAAFYKVLVARLSADRNISINKDLFASIINQDILPDKGIQYDPSVVDLFIQYIDKNTDELVGDLEKIIKGTK